MKELNILYLYSDVLNLYGDHANIDILKYRIEKRNIKFNILEYNIGDEKPNFLSFDIVFFAGGSNKDRSKILSDIIKYKDDIKKAIKNGVFFLLIGQGYEIFGKDYLNQNGIKTPQLDIFPYSIFEDKENKFVGNIITEVELNSNEKIKVLGFENHIGQVLNVATPFGKVLLGKGNNKNENKEGFFMSNVIGTYIHGPLLSKNPVLSDYIIKYSLQRKYEEKVILEQLDDSFENMSRKQLIKKYLI